MKKKKKIIVIGRIVAIDIS